MLNQETREIPFHSRRSSLGRYVGLFFFSDMVYTALLIGLLFIASGFPFVQPSPDPSLVRAIQLFMIFLSPPTLFIVIWVFFFMLFTVRRLASHKPVLLVTLEGVQVRDLPMTGSTFLAWSEVASLFEYRRRSGTYLCFDLREKNRFLSRFHLFQRFFVLLGTLNTGTLIKIPHWFFSESVEEVLSQIQRAFGDQLSQHHVQVFILG